MSDYEQEKWVELYRTAMLEFEHALMGGRANVMGLQNASRADLQPRGLKLYSLRIGLIQHVLDGVCAGMPIS